MKKKILMSLFTIALVGALIGGGVMAVFTSNATSPNNQFTAGTVNISLGNPGTWTGNVTDMKPGDVITFTLTVQNDGNLPVTYVVTPTLSGDLAAHGTYYGGACYVSQVRIDSVVEYSPYNDSLSIAGQGDRIDTIEVDIKMPNAAGNHYQGESGLLTVTVVASS